jgi:uncharacterized membrane protein
MLLALKTGSYSAMHLLVAIGVAYAVTQDWRAALAVGLIEPMVQTVAYVLHDRAWSRIERRGAPQPAPSAFPAPPPQSRYA